MVTDMKHNAPHHPSGCSGTPIAVHGIIGFCHETM